MADRKGYVSHGHPIVEELVKLKEDNKRLRDELADALETLEIQQSASRKRQDCPLCKMNEPPMRATDATKRS
jgi:hypothetical protein